MSLGSNASVAVPTADEESERFRRANGMEPFGEPRSLAGSIAELYTTWQRSGALRYIAAFAVLLGLAYGYYDYLHTNIRYQAQLAFIINEEGDSGGRLNSVIGGLGFGGLGGTSSPLKVLAIARANVITNNVLLDTIQFNGRGRMILLDAVKTAYSEEFELLTENHPYESNPGTIRNRYLQRATELLLTSKDPLPLVDLEVDNDSGVMTIDVKTVDESLSYALSQIYYKHLAKYYTQRAIEPQRATVARLREVRDSLQGVINGSETRIAGLVDQERAMLLNSARLPQQRLERQRQIAQASLVRVTENLAIAEFSMQSLTPYFQIVNDPFVPLPKIKPNYVKSLVLGAVLGGVVGLGILLLHHFWGQIRKEVNNSLVSSTHR